MSGSLPEIELWFDFGSNYSYLSVMRIRAAAARCGVNVRWQPFLLGPIFKSFGWETSPFVLQKEKGAYMWRDMERQCRKYGLPWTRPSVFPRFALLAQRVALLGAREPWIGDFCERIMLMNFAEDRDIGSQDAVTEALERLGLDAGSRLAAAQTGENKQRLRDQTEAARARGVFGAPTFFARGEMFWGNDRLDEALAFAAGAA
jgi:2-hydroxychromene-2-carboxylate isomerase